ncbi:MAG: hypothetical protein AAFR46_17190 [Pseudomonadota bacterium]
MALLLNRVGRRMGRLRGLAATLLLLLLAGAGPGALGAEPARVAAILPSPISNIGQYLLCPVSENQRYRLRSEFIAHPPCRDGKSFAGFGAALSSVSTVPPRVLSVTCSEAASPTCEIQPGPEKATGGTREVP